MKEISQTTFFKIGMWVFIITAILNTGSLIISYPYMNIFSIASSIVNIFFNIILALFFYSFSKGGTMTNKELEEFENKFIDYKEP